MNYKYSKEIYKELVTGKYINKNLLNEAAPQTNILYEEIDESYEEYYELFEKIGYILKTTSDSYYLIADEIQEEVLSKHQIKEYVLMIAIVRYMIENKMNIEMLTNHKYGISKDKIENMLIHEGIRELLEAAEISKHTKPVEEILVKRNILQLNSKGNFVSTDISEHFLKTIQEEGMQLLKDI